MSDPRLLEDFSQDDDTDYELEESLVPVTDEDWGAKRQPRPEQDNRDALAFADDDGRGRLPSPFKPAQLEKEKERVPEKQPEKALERVANNNDLIPPAARDASARALAALAEVREGQPLSADLRRRFEKAIQDASLIDATKAAAEDKRLTDELSTKARKMPDGTVLPVWTEAKEKELWEQLSKTRDALMAIPEAKRDKIVSLQAALNSIPANQRAKRMQIEMLMYAESETASDPTGTVKAYLAQKVLMDKFAKDNADGIERRRVHQQELALLHAPAICATFYAQAMDRAGSLSDLKAVQKNIKTAIADKFTVNNFPDVLALKQKYGIDEEDPFDDSVPGRVSLKKAIGIVDDLAEGTAVERLKKAEKHFQSAIGAADEIDLEKAGERLKEIGKRAAELGEDGDPKILEALDKEGSELLEKFRQPGVSRLRYAMALSAAAAESKDEKLSEKAVVILKQILKVDAGAAYDPLIQGAIKIASERPPKEITPKAAMDVGQPEVDRIKKEDEKNGTAVKEEDKPFWQKALRAIGDNAVFFAAYYLLSYAFKPIGAAKNMVSRQWNQYKQLNRVQVEESAGMKPGDPPKLVHKDGNGKERDVSGVSAENGRLRVTEGEAAEAVKLKGKDALILKVPPGTKLSPEQAREAALKLLTPKTAEQALHDIRRQYELELRQKQIELEQLRAKQAELERAASSGKPAEIAKNGQGRPIADEMFNDSMLREAERRATDRVEKTLALETVEGPNGLKILADKVSGREMVKRLEQFTSEKAFRDMLEREIKNAQEGSEERKALERELEKYNGLSVADKALMRESALKEAVEMHNARMQGKSWKGTALKAIGVAGTLFAVGMLAEYILSNCKSSRGSTAPPANPTVK